MHALNRLGKAKTEWSMVKDVADTLGLPKAYLARIMGQLCESQIVVSKRGYSGGIALAKPPAEISLLQIVEAVDGKNWVSTCVFGLDHCPLSRKCPAHTEWGKLTEQFAAVLGKTTLADMGNVHQPALRLPKLDAMKPALKRGRRPRPTEAG